MPKISFCATEQIIWCSWKAPVAGAVSCGKSRPKSQPCSCSVMSSVHEHGSYRQCLILVLVQIHSKKLGALRILKFSSPKIISRWALGTDRSLCWTGQSGEPYLFGTYENDSFVWRSLFLRLVSPVLTPCSQVCPASYHLSLAFDFPPLCSSLTGTKELLTFRYQPFPGSTGEIPPFCT